MPERIIKHQAIANKWILPNHLDGIKTLVLGSFNPYEPNNKQADLDYYYGRSANYFWKVLAKLDGRLDDEGYFISPDLPLTERLDRKVALMKGRFACVDVIKEIKVVHDDAKTLDTFIADNIYTNFEDPIIWTTQRRVEPKVFIGRTYNTAILDLLSESDTIKNVIHTTGKNTISHKGVKPKEKPLGENGFLGYMNSIWDICEKRNINFIFESQSPSQTAVHKGGKVVPIEALKKQYSEYLILND
jgi:hypothetical protein